MRRNKAVEVTGWRNKLLRVICLLAPATSGFRSKPVELDD